VLNIRILESVTAYHRSVAELLVVLKQHGDKFVVYELDEIGRDMEVCPYYWQPNPVKLIDVQINRKIAHMTVILKETLNQVTFED
jgi:hypothetical protein